MAKLLRNVRGVNNPEQYISRLEHFAAGIGMDVDRFNSPGITGKHISISDNVPPNVGGYMDDANAFGFDMHTEGSSGRPYGSATGLDSTLTVFRESRHMSPTNVYLYGTGDVENNVLEVYKYFHNPIHPDKKGESSYETQREETKKLLKRMNVSGTVDQNANITNLRDIDEDEYGTPPVDLSNVSISPSKGLISGHSRFLLGPENFRRVTRGVDTVFHRINRHRNAVPNSNEVQKSANLGASDFENSIFRRTSPHMFSPQFMRVDQREPREPKAEDRFRSDVIDLKTGNWAKIDPEGYFSD